MVKGGVGWEIILNHACSSERQPSLQLARAAVACRSLFLFYS